MIAVQQKHLLRAALDYARQGVPVFPSDHRKRPITRRGFKDASTDPAEITRMFSKPGAALIGIPTGRITGIVAIDVDPKHGGDVWLRDNQHGLPRTTAHGTPSGGLHLLFQDPEEARLRCSQNLVGKGVDVRANGGSVIVPPGLGYSVTDPEPPARMPDGWSRHACVPNRQRRRRFRAAHRSRATATATDCARSKRNAAPSPPRPLACRRLP
jgi:Bifunctional DNA primase/polymerase, N-terminal